MIIGAISFDLDASPSAGLKLVSADGLAPLPMPGSIIRFQTAMEDDSITHLRVFASPREENVSRRGAVVAEAQRDAAVEKPVVTEREVKTGLAGLREAGAGKQVVDVAEINFASPREENVSRRGAGAAEAQRDAAVEKPVAAEREVKTGQAGLAGLREAGAEKRVVDVAEINTGLPGLERPAAGTSEAKAVLSGFEKPAAEQTARVDASIQGPVNLESPVKETGDAAAPLRVFASPRAENVSRRGAVVAEARREAAVEEPVVAEREVKTGLAGLREAGAGKQVVDVAEINFASPREENVSRRGAVVAEAQRDAAVEKPVVTEKETETVALHAVPAPQAAAPVEAMPAPQVAAVQSARTEAIVEAVGKMVEVVNQVVEAVVAEIAVTPTLAHGEGEIRITLKPTVLDGSEIWLSAKSGELTVTISPATVQSAQIVQQNLPRLETALAEHVSSFHHVAVVVSAAKKGKIDETA